MISQFGRPALCGCDGGPSSTVTRRTSIPESLKYFITGSPSPPRSAGCHDCIPTKSSDAAYAERQSVQPRAAGAAQAGLISSLSKSRRAVSILLASPSRYRRSFLSGPRRHDERDGRKTRYDGNRCFALGKFFTFQRFKSSVHRRKKGGLASRILAAVEAVRVRPTHAGGERQGVDSQPGVVPHVARPARGLAPAVNAAVDHILRQSAVRRKSQMRRRSGCRSEAVLPASA